MILCKACESPIITEWRKDKYYIKHNELCFCSRKCANTQTPSATTKTKIAQSLRSRIYISKRKAICANKACKKSFIKQNQKTQFCSPTCWKNHININKSSKQLYTKGCKFMFNIYHYPLFFNLLEISKHGWYSPSNNLNGISRDHCVSIVDGFEQNIPAALIAHPANCRLIPHRDNQRKKTKSIYSLPQLLEQIYIFRYIYPEFNTRELQRSVI